MLVKVMKSQRYVVAICDTELLGKKFEEGKLQLDLKESFFNGEEMNEEEAISLIIKMSREDATFHIIGKESINLAVEIGLIDRNDVKTVQGIPFILVLM